METTLPLGGQFSRAVDKVQPRYEPKPLKRTVQLETPTTLRRNAPGLERKLAETEVKITKTQQKYEKERATAQSRALDDLRRGAGQSAERFSPSHFGDTLRERDPPPRAKQPSASAAAS